MATETVQMPGYGIVVDAEDGDEYQVPGYGIVVNNAAAAGVSRVQNPLRGPNPFRGPIG